MPQLCRESAKQWVCRGGDLQRFEQPALPVLLQMRKYKAEVSLIFDSKILAFELQLDAWRDISHELGRCSTSEALHRTPDPTVSSVDPLPRVNIIDHQLETPQVGLRASAPHIVEVRGQFGAQWPWPHRARPRRISDLQVPVVETTPTRSASVRSTVTSVSPCGRYRGQ